MHQQRIAMQDNQSQSASPEKPKGAWTRIDNAVLPVLAKIHGMAIGVYIALKSHANKDGICWPELESIARLSGASVPTVQRILKAMIDNKLLIKRNRNRAAGRMSNLYQFTNSPMVPQTSGVIAQWSHRPSPMVPQTNGPMVPQTNELDPYEQDPLNNIQSKSTREGGKKRLHPPKGEKKKRGTKTTTGGATNDVSTDQIPTELDSPEFRDTWQRWLQHRCELKKPIPATSRAALLNRLAKLGETAVEALEASIEHTWVGIPGIHFQRGDNNGKYSHGNHNRVSNDRFTHDPARPIADRL
jgi:hypothetical protein